MALNSVLTDAVLAGAIAANPVRELGIRRKRKSDPKVKGAPALGVHQVRALLTAIQRVRAVLAEGSPRPSDRARGHRCCDASELLALRWEDVDLDGRILTIGGSVVRLKGQGLVAAGHDQGRGGTIGSAPPVRSGRAAPSEG